MDMTLTKVTAEHTNGYVKCSLCAKDAADAAEKAQGLRGRGYWKNIAVVTFEAKPMKGRL